MTYKEPNQDFYIRHDLEEGDPRIRYIVTSGEYSDYKIRGVFDSDKARADIYAEKICGRVEEYEVNLEQQTIPEEWAWVVRMKRDGTCKVSREDMEEREEEIRGDKTGYRNDRDAFISTRYDGTSDMYADVYAKDEAGAAKIANEYRTQAIALGIWPETFGRRNIDTLPKTRYLRAGKWSLET